MWCLCLVPAEFLIQGRQRSLYERQKVYRLRPRVRPAPPKGPPPEEAQIPLPPSASRCSGTSESCLPQSRCCDPCASCHCRFFNAVCFCLKANSFCAKEA
ncbi:hypothetical protein NHX12_021661 [Muraenolepis orangiensis]|uniref:Agouti domain-containing protein n=1 Tax=Muraenolepis orangiensis TaxID=630683 RepID=A0A9Q0EQY4_9TELE|nr:hypothetical protein NHX12_021661 [Muraenolepis orangiensis]